MKYSYICLIYKSIDYINFFLEQFYKYTKLEKDDEFYFLANDASIEVLEYLKNNNIPHYIHNNTEEQKKEWYINNVYRAWNKSIQLAKGEYIILLNSDFGFSENWSENLKNHLRNNNCVCSRLVERGPNDGGLSSGKYGIEKSFGNNPHNYRENDFINYCKNISINELNKGGLYMPLLLKKDYMEKINYYPEGNILEGSDIFNPIYLTSHEVYNLKKNYISGDDILMRKLQTIGIEHFTAFNSIVYHFQEGEMKYNVFESEFHFYGNKFSNEKTIDLFIYFSEDGRMRTECEYFNRSDGWIYNMKINTFINNNDCNKYYIYRKIENLNKNIYENTIISKAPPNIFLNSEYFLISKVYLKNFIPFQNTLENTIKYYYNNGSIQII